MAKNTDKYEMIDISELHPYENNARTHSEAQLEAICNSIKEFGFINPVIIDENNMILVGHGRIEASKRLGIKQAPFRRVTNLTDDQKRAYILADNRLSDLGGWDEEMLAQELESISLDMSAFGFDDFNIDIDEPEPEIAEDDFDVDGALEMKSRVERGQVWRLGEHFLMCGDSTSAEDINKLMNGKKADMVFTDPPYGVDYQGINNDDREGLERLLDKAFYNMQVNSKVGVSVYCFHSDRCADIFHKIFRKYCHFSSMIIWKKPTLTLSQTDYQSIHEPCLYGWFNNGTHNFYGDRKQTSVWEYERENISEHTTPKPIKLICQAIKNSSMKDQFVLDLFGGSGSTLIACEQLKRKCYMMELDEHYCEVIIQRWEQLTGKKAELIK
jgi:DNA modification methylase